MTILPHSRVATIADETRALPLHLASGTLALAAVCIALGIFPAAPDLLQYDRQAIAAGQWWRWLSGHLVHWNAEHAFWDIAVLIALGSLCDPQSRRRLWLTMLIAAVVISAGVWLCLPQLETYRGLSGLDTALFTLLATRHLHRAIRGGRRRHVLLIGGLLAGFAGKTAFELLTGHTLFVDDVQAGFQAVPLAHLLGALVGLITAVVDTMMFIWCWALPVEPP